MCGKSRFFIAAILLAAPALASAVEVSRPAFTPPATLNSGSIVQIVFSLLMVLAAIVLVAWLLKRMNVTQQGSGNLLKILGGVAIGQRERIVLVEVKDTWLVIGVGPGQIRTLHTLNKQELQNTGNSTPPLSESKFAQLLSSVLHHQTSDKKRNAP